ncbi:MAG TPA: helix-turn-helix transcriptional regulator [Ramlibacter sp.]|nr:helix-turn-helix transcriptional regulator [Ramlibacter sp.]
MQHWTVSSGESQIEVGVASVSRLIAAIGSKDRTALASAVLALVRGQVQAHHCSMLSFEGERSPRIISGASVQHQWHVFNIASAYARDFYRKDSLQRLIGCYPASFEAPPVVVQRQGLEDIDDPEYRQQCYECIGIGDRASVLVRVGRAQSLVVNLYRDRTAGNYSAADIDHLIGLAPLIAGCAARHYALDVDGESSFRGAVTDQLAELCPQLTLREREVVQRILDGMTTERISDDLHIRPTTVITYRTRAYEKMKVTTRRELFAAVLRRGQAGHESEPEVQALAA